MHATVPCLHHGEQVARVVYRDHKQPPARVWEHKHDELAGFTRKYRIHRLVYYETFKYVGNAIAREKHIKGWLRTKKIALIESVNPTWEDLSDHWGDKIELANPEIVPLAAKSRSFAPLRMTNLIRTANLMKEPGLVLNDNVVRQT